MDKSITLPDENFTIHLITPCDTEIVQDLLKECEQFNLLVEGQPVSPDAAKNLFQDVPAGRSAEEKLVYGIFDRCNKLTGVLEVFPDYPEPAVWWIGLLLLDPAARARGLGSKTVKAVCELVKHNGGREVMLGVVEENKPGFKFWQRMGFTLERITEPRTFGEKQQRVMVMKLALSQARDSIQPHEL
jgi:GNAT superfamily N-acetyltransferase